MASVGSYRTKDGKELFSARWREGGRGGPQMRKRGFTSKRAAQRYADEQEADARRGLTPLRSDQTVTEYARHWASTRPHRRTSAVKTAWIIESHIAPTKLGGMKLADVRKSHIQGWATDRAKVLAPYTMKKNLSTLRSIFQSAVHDRLVLTTPVVGISLPKADERAKIVPLTTEQVDALAAAMPARYRAMVPVQAGLGLRVGELLALRVQDFNPLLRTVRIEWQFSNAEKDENGWPVRAELKTKGSKRTIPLPKRVADAVAAHLAAYGPAADGTIFTNGRGRPVGSFYYVGDVFPAAVEKAGLPADATSHDLRHHFASELMASRKLTDKEIGELLGHEDGSLVQKTYGHVTANAADRALAAMNAIWTDAV